MKKMIAYAPLYVGVLFFLLIFMISYAVLDLIVITFDYVSRETKKIMHDIDTVSRWLIRKIEP